MIKMGIFMLYILYHNKKKVLVYCSDSLGLYKVQFLFGTNFTTKLHLWKFACWLSLSMHRMGNDKHTLPSLPLHWQSHFGLFPWSSSLRDKVCTPRLQNYAKKNPIFFFNARNLSLKFCQENF